MKKSFLLWMGVALMMAIGMSSCSSDDDDYSYVQEFGDNNNKENFIGTWHLLHYYTGWGIKEDYEAGRLLLHSPKTETCKLSIKEMTSILFQRANRRILLSILKNPFLQESQELVCLLAIFLHIAIPLIKDFFTFLKKPTMVMAILSRNWNNVHSRDGSYCVLLGVHRQL